MKRSQGVASVQAVDVRVSLIHATWFSPSGPRALRDRWLEAASSPELVEYVVGMDDTDVTAIAETASELRAIGPAHPDTATAVRNWNSAAALSSGDMLFVISDDLHPSPGWDDRLRSLVRDRTPREEAFAMVPGTLIDPPEPAVTRGRMRLMRPWLPHPVVSRAFYDRFGLFDPHFEGVYCDNDLTLRAYWNAYIIDARQHIICIDRPRHTGPDARLHGSGARQRGWEILSAKWPFWRRTGRIHLIRASRGRFSRGRWARVRASANRTLTLSLVPAALAESALRSLVRSLLRL
jgi:hypothetical protein